VKLIFIGDVHVGKTSLMNALLGKDQSSIYVPTTGPEFHLLQLPHQGTLVRVQMWDTAGQEFYRSVTRMYCRNCQIVLCCYQISLKSSFENIDAWIDLLGDDGQKAAVVLVGTKKDLSDGEKVTVSEVMAKAEDCRYRFIQTSAVTKEGIEDLKGIIGELGKETLKQSDEVMKSNWELRATGPTKSEKCC
jgi:small GTP-binding protein